MSYHVDLPGHELVFQLRENYLLNYSSKIESKQPSKIKLIFCLFIESFQLSLELALNVAQRK